MTPSNLTPQEYGAYYQTYISMLQEGDMLEELEISLHRFIHFVREIPLGKHDYRYAEGKWTIKDIIQHLIDSERIFAYRALRIARFDQTPLPGFEEDAFAANANANARHLQSLLTELALVRESTLSLFRTFTHEMLTNIGIASESPVSVRAIGFIITGHMMHHQKIFAQRYL